MSIRLRLMVWYSAFLGAMLFLFSLGLYSFLTNALLADVSDTLKSQGERAAACLLYTSPSPRDRTRSRMPSSA